MYKFIAAVLVAATAFGQSPAPARVFEVASIEAGRSPTDGRFMVRMGGDAGGSTSTSMSA